MSIPSLTCDDLKVTLQWTPPTDTGGQNVGIQYYNITGLPHDKETCSPGPCNMITGTTTTITGNINIAIGDCMQTRV